MKHIEELIHRYIKNDIHLTLENGELRYNAPKGALSQEMMTELSNKKNEIILYLGTLKEATQGFVNIIRLPNRETLPLSYSQEQLLFLDQAAGIDSTYNMMSVFRLKGKLNLSAIHQSFNDIVNRHEVLRSTYHLEKGEPLVSIHEDVCPSLLLKDFSSFNAGDRMKKAREWINHETQIPFDLAMAPLFRISLGMLDINDFLLVLTIHHIISDGWSMNVLFREWELLYNSQVTGQSLFLKQLAIQYADYAAYQRGEDQKKRQEIDLEYWRNRLEGAPDLLELPTDYPRPAIQSYQGRTERVFIDKEITNKLKNLGERHNSTLFMTLMSLFGMLLSRFSGQDDIVIGSPLADRGHPQLSELIGFFINTIPYRFDFSSVTTFDDLFLMVRDNIIDTYDHLNLPFEVLVDRLNPKRNKGYSPIVQVLLVLQNTSQIKPSFTGVEAEAWKADIKTSKVDLTLMITEGNEGLECEWEFNTALFKDETIRWLSGCFGRLCEFSVLDPNQLLSEFMLLTKTEYRKTVIDWNQTQTDYPRESTVHELFEKHALMTPQATALIQDGKRMTYGELNQKADQLKERFLAWGLRKEESVGIYLERSFNMIVALLGVLKAGGIYVPLDLSYPEKRIQYMLDDANINILLTQTALKDRISTGERQVICLDKPWDKDPIQSTQINCPVSADQLAYIIYTSGSTGLPKGTTIPHRAINRLVKNTNYLKISPEDVFFQGAPISFDAATLEIWGPLLNGARLVLPPPHTMTLKEIGELLTTNKVSILWLTAGLFHLMVDDNNIKYLNKIKQLLAGGDVLSVPHVKKALRDLDGCVVINGYGPTENTTFSCCYRMMNEEQVGRTVSIGKPIANTQAYILDKHLTPLPVGVPGELCLGGDGLARNYLNRPELTEKSFINNPFSQDPNARLYRTGDLARYLPDGNIELLGRMDRQIKIRGFRIEIGEVETTISSSTMVKDVVVTCREDLPGGRGLVAYLVINKKASPPFSLETLRAQVESWLPDYMHPEYYTVLESFPLTPNGKVDRDALPAPKSDSPEPVEVKSSSSLEQLVEICKQLLNVDTINTEDSFFEKGGNSLAIIRLISEVEATFNVVLSIADMIELPSLKALSVKIDSLMEMTDHLSPVPSSESSLSDEIGKKLIGITEKIFDQSGINLEDNFFERGGNSLAIIRFISEIDETFGTNLSIADFIELPNLNQLVEIIAKHGIHDKQTEFNH